MSRRNISKKRFPEKDSVYNSYLVSLLITRILKSGKKTIAKKIVYDAFEIIQKKTDDDPLKVFEDEILAKVRSTGKLLEANVNFNDQNGANVNLKNPEDGISPGQACVFYNQDRLGYKVLGGGWIKE